MDLDTKTLLIEKFNLPTELINELNMIMGSTNLVVSNIINNNIIKVYIPSYNTQFYIYNSNENKTKFQLECKNAINLTAELIIWSTLFTNYKHYNYIFENKGKIIFSYSFNRRIFLYKFLQKNYFNLLYYNKKNTSCLCKECQKISLKLNLLKNNFKRINSCFLKLIRQQHVIIKEMHFINSNKIFSQIEFDDIFLDSDSKDY